ncbi:MAG: copper homeostasis protein CutC [Eudoraea sp.]|nr:copper homeostasis protein CutC [Eudoraea sp.]
MLVEVCVQSVEAAIIAAEAGADRLELCEDLVSGGVTPSEELVRQIQRSCDIPLHILIRPGAGGFAYTNAEYEKILQEINRFKQIGVTGIVIGILKEDRTINLDRIKEIRNLTNGIHLTFHRAFDQVPDPIQASKNLEEIGVDTLLTSGQRNTAMEGLDLLKELKEMVTQMIIMPGAGINPDNIKSFKDAGFEAVHFSGTRKVGSTPGIPGVVNGNEKSDDTTLVFEPDWIHSMIKCVK